MAGIPQLLAWERVRRCRSSVVGPVFGATTSRGGDRRGTQQSGSLASATLARWRNCGPGGISDRLSRRITFRGVRYGI